MTQVQVFSNFYEWAPAHAHYLVNFTNRSRFPLYTNQEDLTWNATEQRNVRILTAQEEEQLVKGYAPGEDRTHDLQISLT